MLGEARNKLPKNIGTRAYLVGRRQRRNQRAQFAGVGRRAHKLGVGTVGEDALGRETQQLLEGAGDGSRVLAARGALGERGGAWPG